MKNIDLSLLKDVWGRHPVEIPLPTGFQLFAENELANALKLYGSKDQIGLKASNKFAEYVTSVDGIATKEPISAFVMQASDRSLDDYLSRVDHINRSHEWSIAYFGLHGTSAKLWDRSRHCIDAILKVLGHRPAGRVDVDCFIGRYASTPVGIHVDYAHNFGFTYREGKTMYTWPFTKKELLYLKTPAYDAHKKDAIVLENRKNQLCYFPYDYLHVAETQNNVSLNVNISIWQSSKNTILNFLESKFVSQSVTKSLTSHSGAISLPDDVYKNINTTKQLIESSRLERQAALTELLFITTSGLSVPRPIDITIPFDVGKSFALNVQAMLGWYLMEDLNEILIASNGHCISCNYSDQLLAVLQLIINNKNRLKGGGRPQPFSQKDIEADYHLFKFFYQTGQIIEIV